MNAVILQPSYIPWRGYFHQIAKADLFIFYDDVQYDKRGWRNRNRIKTPNGTRWLTIPVHSKGAQIESIPICDIKISWEKNWAQDHWRTIQTSYAHAPFFSTYRSIIERFYQQQPEFLADFTIDTTMQLTRLLGNDKTQFLRSSSLKVSGTKTDRLLAVLKAVGATHYISGPSARDYIDNNKFVEAGISLEYMQYDYQPYDQLYPPFDPQVSILDLLFMTGPNAMQNIINAGE